MVRRDHLHKCLLFLLCMIIFGSMFVLLYLAAAGNNDQIYKDIIAGSRIAGTSGNKSIEMHLLYILIFAGLICYTLFYYFQIKRGICGRTQEKSCLQPPDYGRYFLAAVCVMAGIYSAAYSGPNQMMIASMMYAVILFLTDKDLVVPGMIFLHMAAFGTAAVYRIYAWLGGMQEQNESFVTLAALFIAVILLLFSDRQAAFRRGILIFQLFVPMLLLIFTKSEYLYQEEFITIQTPIFVKLFVLILVAVFLAEAVVVLKKNWRSPGDFSRMISLGSCAAIMAFNRFSGTGAVMSTDMHHPFENIIGYSQIFKMGQKAFEEYIPISGLYSVVQGAVFELFGKGLFADYYVTQNVFYTLVVLAVVYLLNKQADRKLVFLIALYMGMGDYNRNIFILPLMLLLSMPKLVERKNLWLKVWFITSFLHGLYYPLFGAAVCAAFLPLSIWQIVNYIRSGELKKDVKKISFWTGWGICILPVLAGIPLLTGTYRHIRAMSDQSVIDAGITCFSKMPPDDFFPFFSEYVFIRVMVYLVLTFMIPAAASWIAYAMALKFIGTRDGALAACLGFSLVIMPAISYSYTFVRLDNLLSRSQAGLIAAAVMLLIITFRYIQEEKLRMILFICSFFILAISQTNGVAGSSWKLSPYYTVPEGYVYVSDDGKTNIGTGFMEENQYQAILSGWENAKNFDKDASYLGSCGYFGYYYLYGLKGISTIETETIKGYGAVQETADLLKEQRNAVVGGISPFGHYYLYHWLVTSGEYTWDSQDRVFYPSVGLEYEETAARNKEIDLSGKLIETGKAVASWGSSFDSMADIFGSVGTEIKIEHFGSSANVLFSESVDGSDADFLYLEFGDIEHDVQYVLSEAEQQMSWLAMIGRRLMKKNYNTGKKITVTWQDEYGEDCGIKCDIGKGKLLIPLGAGQKWLLHEHDRITVKAEWNGEKMDVPGITDIQLLKLREVQ